jgi:hypothetical protein
MDEESGEKIVMAFFVDFLLEEQRTGHVSSDSFTMKCASFRHFNS